MTIIYRVSTWQELYALPNFAEEPISRDLITKGDLAGDYEVASSDGLRPCGILKCETDHRHGYIVLLPDQRLSHVGRDCGRTHFGESWSRKRKAFTEAQKQAAKIKAVDELKTAIRARLDRWPVFDTPAYEGARLALAHFDRLPEKVRSSLESRAQSGDVAVYAWRPLRTTTSGWPSYMTGNSQSPSGSTATRCTACAASIAGLGSIT